jgi:hypothetical protein
MCCFLIFDKVQLDWGWIGLMARSGPSYLLSDHTLRQGSLHVGAMGRTCVRPIAQVLFTRLGRAYCPNTLTVFVMGEGVCRRRYGSPAQG